ncbi:hypothetical protein [Nannocystis pusilla]|uniref:hypothetical protein n=1 Tax=Nannocystis pusilla TaxID=889268 RepID=UPI003B7845F7
MRDAVASLERRIERVTGLRYALGAASQYGLVLHCDDYTLGAHPDPEKRENGEPALIDWRQTGGVVVAEGSDAAQRLLEVCGVVRVLEPLAERS